MRRLTLTAILSFMLSLPGPLIDAGGLAPRAAAAGATYVVNSADDQPDADVGIPACADATGHCTLRAAVMQANRDTQPDTITVPSGIFLLKRVGNDDDATLGDLDITHDLTLQGAGPGFTIVDGNGAVTSDRVFQILSSATNTTLSGLTIRAGQKISGTFDEGGGLLWDGGGGQLHLSQVVIEGNRASYGGGVYLNYSTLGDSVSLDHITVRANTATAAAGGLAVNFGDFAGFDLRDSQVYSNTAYEAGGLYFQGQLVTFDLLSARIATTDIYSNTASLSAGMENHSGDAARPVTVLDSHLHDNQAGYYGGAIGNYGTMVISNTTLSANSAGVRGGGLYDYEGGQVDLAQSTLSDNHAQTGGGIFSEHFIHDTAALTLTNSTVSGNSASRDGGGLYLDGGQAHFFNTTIASNQVVVPLGTFYAGLGGGIYISTTAAATAQSALIANNSHRYGVLPPEPDNCNGTLASLGYNLIRDVTNCLVIGDTLTNITSQDPLLGPLQLNGGAAATQALLAGSPAIDAAQTLTPGCTDANGALLATDQRGWARPRGAHCDIGAFEYYPPALFLPLIRR